MSSDAAWGHFSGHSMVKMMKYLRAKSKLSSENWKERLMEWNKSMFCKLQSSNVLLTALQGTNHLSVQCIFCLFWLHWFECSSIILFLLEESSTQSSFIISLWVSHISMYRETGTGCLASGVYSLITSNHKRWNDAQRKTVCQQRCACIPYIPSNQGCLEGEKSLCTNSKPVRQGNTKPNTRT